MSALSTLAIARRLLRRPPAAAKAAPAADPLPPGGVRFQCNVCGTAQAAAPSDFARETRSCASCGSTVRFRAMAHLVVQEVLGVTRALTELPRAAHIRGLGLSDDEGYARRLAVAFDYTNTYFHQAPRFDITAVPREHHARYDFVVASDVFEHVVPPVDRAFAGARALLKPRGVLVFTVPFTLEPDTVEHFPELHDWRLLERNGAWSLHNVTTDGRHQAFDDLVFHGGPGSTLEMRRFSRDALLRAFERAGFARVRVADEACPAFGIEWTEPFSVPMVAYAG